jgi:hypothetical protein
MTKTRQEDRATEHPGVEKEALPLAMLTVTIDQKRLTPAIFKQFAEEDVVDEETGELRGTPVGYFNIHPKEGCPEGPHKHVLWGKGTHLRMATIVARDNDPRYEEREQASLRRRQEILHLLALLLAGAGEPYTLEEASDDEYELKIAGYTLYVDDWVPSLLERYQQAREQVQRDLTALRESGEPEASGLKDGSNASPVPFESRIEGARKVMQRLIEQGVALTHPDLYEHEDERYTTVYGEYDDESIASDEWMDERRKRRGWKVYPAEGDKEQEKALIYWRKKSGLDIATTALEMSIEPHALPFRVLIGERLTAEDKGKIQAAALKLAKSLDMFAALAKGATKAPQSNEPSISALSSLDPSAVWKQYEQERKRFEAYTRTWDGHLASINALEQLFLISG